MAGGARERRVVRKRLAVVETNENLLDIVAAHFQMRHVWQLGEMFSTVGVDREAVVSVVTCLIQQRKVERLLPIVFTEDSCPIGSEPPDTPIFYRWCADDVTNSIPAPSSHLIRHSEKVATDARKAHCPEA